jgi:hypothetical protein
MGGACSRYGGGERCAQGSVGKPLGKRPLGRPRRRWEDKIKMDLQEVGRGCADWMELAQDRERWRAFVRSVMNFPFPKNAGSFLTSCRTS